jgi:integrase
MASISREPNGAKTIQFVDRDKRRSIRLGKVTEKTAQSVRLKVESIFAANASGQPLDQETATWLGKIDPTLYGRLVKVGLAQPRQGDAQPATLTEVLGRYIRGRSKIKANTLRNYETTKRLLEQHFGKDRDVGSIHAGNARDYREWLVGKYSQATVSREIKRARQFFEYAKDSRLTGENPFAKIKAGSQKNTSRKEFVSRDVIDAVLAACPDNEWRLIVALARYGGLRIPSELADLTWDRIIWDRNRLIVRVPKKEHLDGHGQRELPIFPEVRPYLEQAFDEAPEGSVYVTPRGRSSNVNLRTGLQKIVKKAGVAKWGKLFQNLRASRETELMRECPAHVVRAWLGNSREVAEDHYLMVTDEDFLRAANPLAAAPPTKAVQNPVQSGAVRDRQEPSPETEPAVQPAIANCTAVQVPPRGVEPRFSD